MDDDTKQPKLFGDESEEPAKPEHEWPEHWSEYPASLYRGEPPSVDVETSIEAAHSMKDQVSRLAALVLAYISHKAEGSTSDQAELALELSHQTCSARFRELALRGRIHSNGEKRLTQSGRPALVWRAK